MMDRIIGALTFRKGVYAEVENDTTFTPTAWLIVFVANLLGQLGANAGDGSINFVEVIVAAIFAVISFAAFSWVVVFVARSMFKADVDFNQVVRAVGLASVWQTVGFLAILGLIGTALTCIVAPVLLLGWILWVAAALIAVREALDLEWGNTVIVLIVAVIAYIVVAVILGLIAAAIGISASLIGGALGAATP
jgi:hypothetical protein